jgi:hypothetical protein
MVLTSILSDSLWMYGYSRDSVVGSGTVVM